MMMLNSNKQKMYYALQIGEVPIYEYYTDSDGNKFPVGETGEYKIGYGKPVEFFGNIAMSGGESKAVEYGIDVSAYDAILIVDKGALPLTETSLIWVESEVSYEDTEKTIVDPNSADYKVKKPSPSLNVGKYILNKVVK